MIEGLLNSFKVDTPLFTERGGETNRSEHVFHAGLTLGPSPVFFFYFNKRVDELEKKVRKLMSKQVLC